MYFHKQGPFKTLSSHLIHSPIARPKASFPFALFSMLSLARRIRWTHEDIRCTQQQLRFARTDAGSGSAPGRNRRSKFSPTAMLRKTDDKSEWWAMDGEMHEIGENVPLRERFVIPRDNIPNRRRKQLREQFMRRTRLVLKESEHEPWCKRYMELYSELRETWERLYWDDGYTKKLGEDHANYDSVEEDEEDFNPYRAREPHTEQMKVRNHVLGRNTGSDNWGRVNHIRDKFEYDRERRMRERAFAPMHGGNDIQMNGPLSNREPFDIRRYISESDAE